VKRTEHTHNGFRRPITISAVGHLVILAILVFVPDLSLSLFGERPVRINAIWVDIPRGTSEELGTGMKLAENLPQSTIEEQKKLFQPEKIEQQTLTPEMTAPPPQDGKEISKKAQPPPERPKIDARATRRNDPKAKPEPVKISRTDKKIMDALAKIDKDLKGRTIVPEASQIEKNQEGYKYGTSDKPMKVAPSDPEYLKYQAMVRGRIIREWIVPSKFTDEGSAGYSARIEVLINTDGDVVSVRWESPSGDTTFDQSAVRAVRKASPFPKPPDRLAWEAYNEGFLVEFDPRLKPTY